MRKIYFIKNAHKRNFYFYYSAYERKIQEHFA